MSEEFSLIHADRKVAFRLAAWSSLLLLGYSAATLLVVVFIGGPPESVEQCFQALARSRAGGLLRLDILTVFIMPLYFVLFYGLFVALVRIKPTIVVLSTAFVFAGVILFLAAPGVFSYLTLSDTYWSATSDAVRNNALSAAEAILVSDIWHGTGARIGGILVQLGATVISIVMLRSPLFTKLTSITGIAMHGLDLLHMIIGFGFPAIANAIMTVSGVMYLLWFPLIARALFKIAKPSSL